MIRQIRGPMQRYSLLMIPNYINQWLMKTLDKYFILFYLGAWSNGIYTVAHRFPDMLVMLNSMFYSAWVEQAIVEYGSEDRDAYFSRIYRAYSRLLFSVVLLAIPLTKYAIRIFTGHEYFSAYRYVPFLYIGVVFLGLAGFVGTGYLGTKKTGGLMWTSVAGAGVNILVNAALMPPLGLQAAGISSFCAYGVMWLARIIQTRKFFSIKIYWGEFCMLTVLSLLFAAGVQADSLWLDTAMSAAGAGACIHSEQPSPGRSAGMDSKEKMRVPQKTVLKCKRPPDIAIIPGIILYLAVYATLSLFCGTLGNIIRPIPHKTGY